MQMGIKDQIDNFHCRHCTELRDIDLQPSIGLLLNARYIEQRRGFHVANSGIIKHTYTVPHVILWLPAGTVGSHLPSWFRSRPRFSQAPERI